MLMCSLSVVFTVLVLNYHHRTPDTHEMPRWVSSVHRIVLCLFWSIVDSWRKWHWNSLDYRLSYPTGKKMDLRVACLGAAHESAGEADNQEEAHPECEDARSGAARALFQKSAGQRTGPGRRLPGWIQQQCQPQLQSRQLSFTLEPLHKVRWCISEHEPSSQWNERDSQRTTLLNQQDERGRRIWRTMQWLEICCACHR